MKKQFKLLGIICVLAVLLTGCKGPGALLGGLFGKAPAPEAAQEAQAAPAEEAPAEEKSAPQEEAPAEENAEEAAAEEAAQDDAAAEEGTAEAAEAEAAEAEAAEEAPAEEEEPQIIELPPYSYTGEDPVEAAVNTYMAEAIAKNYAPADVSIPSICIVDVDDTDPEDTKVWGDFWIFGYKLTGDTLFNTSGGSYPGCMHLKQSEDGKYEVTSFDVVVDGSLWRDSAKEIFGDKFDAFQEMYSDQNMKEQIRSAAIADYVMANDLPIRAYQDYGWDPVILPIYKTYSSADGWSVRYQPELITVNETESFTSFVYTGEAAGTSMVSISLVEDKQPQEVLTELTAPWGNEERMRRIEGLFPGTDDKLGFWRVLDPAPEGSGLAQTAIAGEYNGGVLLFEITTHMSGDDAIDIPMNDVLADLIGSITYEDFQPQVMYDYVPGTYLLQGEEGPAQSITLESGYKGVLHGDKDTDIYWTSTELIGALDAARYEYTIEGDMLLVNDHGTWSEYLREGGKAPVIALADSYLGTWAEQTSERVTVHIEPSEEKGWYDALVTWREDLPQKDVYTMRAKYQEDGTLYYEDCTYVIRTFEEDGTYTDEMQYENGSGLFNYQPDEKVLYWTDYEVEPEENVQIFIRSDERADFAGGLRFFTEGSAPAASIEAFVKEAVDPASENYIPVEDRIAVFDLDGTLMCETYPSYFEYMMFIQRALYDEDYEAPEEMKEYAEALEEGLKTGKLPENADPLHTMYSGLSYAGMTLDEFSDYTREFMKTEAAGFDNLTRADAFYKPMVSVTQYLEANDFQVYIVSGEDRNLVRALIADKLPVPANRVIGTSYRMKASGQGDTDGLEYLYTEDDELVCSGELIVDDLKMNKVSLIAEEIGKVPVLAFGNSSGDLSMAQYTVKNSQYKAKAYMVLCDDMDREFGNLDKAASLKEFCDEHGYETISMHDDFATIYDENVTLTETAE